MSETETTATTDTASQVDAQDVATQETPDAAAEAVTEGADAQTAEASADATKDGEGKDETGPPEAYEFKAPDGMELDRQLVDDFEPLARDLNLTQAQADQMVSLYAEKILPRIEAQQIEAWAEKTASWAKEAKADKELGGDKFEENMGTAKTALDKMGTPELVEFLNTTGLGNHPEMIRLFHRIGKSISDDAFHTPTGTGAKGPVDAAKTLYPTMN